MKLAAVVAAAAGLVPAALAAGPMPMQLFTMPDKGLSRNGAVCLDGSDAGFYFSPAADAANANNWQLYFEGGGWCYDPMDCWGRSLGDLGSSNKWPANLSKSGGIMSSDCEQNPDFCNFNRVYMKYCDGNSFSGNRDGALVVKGKPLYFRGRRIIDAVLATLMTDHNLAKAEQVLLTGCSAGGLATYLHADYVHDALISLGARPTKYKAAPISGFFLLHKTVDGQRVYPEEMQNVFEIANSTGGMNRHCMASLANSGSEWLCNFAQFAYHYTQVPIFPLNSAYDSWQSSCIYGALPAPGFPNQTGTENGMCGKADGHDKCWNDLEKCSAADVRRANLYVEDFNSIMHSPGAYQKVGNGAFIHTCFTHCEAQAEAFSTFKVRGVTMKEAVSQWWAAEGEAADRHSHDGTCVLHADSTPHQCNPSCGASASPAEPLVV